MWVAIGTITSVVAVTNHCREQLTMKSLMIRLWNAKLSRDTRGQDLIEYALMAGFVAVAAGAIMPGVAESISTIFSKVASVMTAASNAS